MVTLRHHAILAVMIGATACSSPSPDDPAQEVADSETVEAAPRSPAPCRSEQLSCGRQRPVPSDGVHPFINEDMGLRAVFEKGSGVCLARSGDAARGFYAHYGAETDCSERGARPPAFIGLYASWNSSDYASLGEAVPDCRPLSPAVARNLEGETLAFPGILSLACQRQEQPGRIEIAVNALAGRRNGGDADGPPATLYTAILGTRPERLEEDLARFRTFLGNVRFEPLP
jgi:hypothetical protein